MPVSRCFLDLFAKMWNFSVLVREKWLAWVRMYDANWHPLVFWVRRGASQPHNLWKCGKIKFVGLTGPPLFLDILSTKGPVSIIHHDGAPSSLMTNEKLFCIWLHNRIIIFSDLAVLSEPYDVSSILTINFCVQNCSISGNFHFRLGISGARKMKQPMHKLKKERLHKFLIFFRTFQYKKTQNDWKDSLFCNHFTAGEEIETFVWRCVPKVPTSPQERNAIFSEKLSLKSVIFFALFAQITTVYYVKQIRDQIRFSSFHDL